jgi:hypothetical protein
MFAAASSGRKVDEPPMLIIKRSGADRSTFLERWETHILARDDSEIGRIEICAPGRHPNQGLVTVQGRQLQCRVHQTGPSKLTFVPARWVMYSEESELYAAQPDGLRTFLIDEVPGLGLLRLRREGLWAGRIFVDRLPDEGRVAEMRFLRGRLLPRPRMPQYHLKSTSELPEIFEYFLAWIVVQAGMDDG